MSAPSQWTLPLEPSGAGGAIMAGASNRAAIEQVLSPWTGAIYLEGPAASGKSLIACAWSAEAGAKIIAASSLDLAAATALSKFECAAIDGLDGLASPNGEEALFHLLNASARHGGRLLLTGRTTPRALEIGLPDLRTRLNALPVVRIEPPDDEFLTRLILHLAERRQLALAEPVAQFLSGRMPRTHQSAINLIEALDRLSLETGRPVTRELAAEALKGAES